LVNPDTYSGGAPRHVYKELRQNMPVYWHAEPAPEVGFWAITRQKDLDFISKNPMLFSSWEKTPFLHVGDDMIDIVRTQLLSMDPPEHIKYRRIVRNAFTPKKVNSYTQRFEKIAEDFIGRAVAGGECEFVEDIAAELPLIAICELMGVPLEDRNKMFVWTNALIGSDDPELGATGTELKSALGELFSYGKRLAEENIINPRNEIISTLISAEVDGEALTESEFCNFFMLLIGAGNETTRTGISHTMKLLIDNPEQYQALVDNPDLIEHAVEEALRYNPPVIAFCRTTVKDTIVGGQLIEKGDKVVMYYQAASSDEEVFESPDQFDITRPLRENVSNNHRAFGVGEHFCLGAHLARTEMKIVLREIVKRIREPQFNGEISWLRSNFINGIKKMPIKFRVV
jgi:cholest-4-en-3-one 26-monooxygenase